MRGSAILGVAALLVAAPAQAQSFTGEIVVSGFGFCPPNTRLANGDLLPIQKEKPASGEDYRDLYLLYGNAYGGDGVTTFALPDMRAQLLAMNDFSRGAMPQASRDPKLAPAMRVELPIVFCVVFQVPKGAR